MWSYKPTEHSPLSSLFQCCLKKRQIIPDLNVLLILVEPLPSFSSSTALWPLWYGSACCLESSASKRIKPRVNSFIYFRNLSDLCGFSIGCSASERIKSRVNSFIYFRDLSDLCGFYISCSASKRIKSRVNSFIYFRNLSDLCGFSIGCIWGTFGEKLLKFCFISMPRKTIFED